MTSQRWGASVLAFLFAPSNVNMRRSGWIVSSILSEITTPQLLQTISPELGSVIVVFSWLQIEHRETEF